MQIQVFPAPYESKPLFRNLMELYNYDLSEFDGADLNEYGLYDYKYLDHYWTEENRYPFLIQVDNKIAGFILVNTHGYVAPMDYSIAEFFICRKYRKSGVGKFAAFEVFNRFRGIWEIRELPTNHASHVFWRKIIGEYTSNSYEELPDGFGDWTGPIQRFDNSFIK